MSTCTRGPPSASATVINADRAGAGYCTNGPLYADDPALLPGLGADGGGVVEAHFLEFGTTAQGVDVAMPAPLVACFGDVPLKCKIFHTFTCIDSCRAPCRKAWQEHYLARIVICLRHRKQTAFLRACRRRRMHCRNCGSTLLLKKQILQHGFCLYEFNNSLSEYIIPDLAESIIVPHTK